MGWGRYIGGLRKGLAEKLMFEQHFGGGNQPVTWRKSGPKGEGRQEAQSKEEGGGRGTVSLEGRE